MLAQDEPFFRELEQVNRDGGRLARVLRVGVRAREVGRPGLVLLFKVERTICVELVVEAGIVV